jgi:hypothetical protein
VTGRYLPADAWARMWEAILGWLGRPGLSLRWTATVRPAYGPTEALPPDVESQALRRSADWIVSKSRILRHPAWPDPVLQWSLTYNTVRDRPQADWPIGDGALGLVEGYSSTIRADGSQPMRYAVRNDNLAEVALLLALDAVVHDWPRSAQIARQLLDFDLYDSGLAQGPRADPRQPSFGLIGWALDSPGSYWGDDNARALLGLAGVAAGLGERRWTESIVRCLLANFRTTGVRGYRPECITERDLQDRGWQFYWEAAGTKFSPHYEGWLWACFCWAYDQTRFEPLLARSRTGIRLLMAAYPQRWDWCNRSATIELARALLPLAWLVRVEDTPEHRGWLRAIANDLVALQDASGGLRETLGDGGPGTASNAEYGTRETSLIQTNGDPVCDLLYSCNFALIGLHEASAATGDPFYRAAEDRLAAFLCRIQSVSQDHPELDGAWYRAFEFRRWEYWASNADWEWGPWCTETGWTQPWIAGTLALRQRKTSLWELLGQTDIAPAFARLRPQMLPDEVLARPSAGIHHAALGRAVALATPFAPQYAPVGAAGLTDGLLGTTNYLDGRWQGCHGTDLAATIDLGHAQSIGTIAVRFLQDERVGIYHAASVDIAASAEGSDFVTLEPVVPPLPADDTGPFIVPVAAEANGRQTRFVRVRAANARVIPAGRPAAGQKAWLFVDEVVVRPAAPAP